MAKTHKAARLRKRVKVNGNWRWCRLAVDRKGRLKPDFVVVNGSEQEHKEGHFGVFWKENGHNRFELAGTDFVEAQTAFADVRLASTHSSPA